MMTFATAFVLYIDKACITKYKKIFFGFVLAVWFLTVFASTVLTRSQGDNYTLTLIPFESYSIAVNEGDAELLRSNYMNIILFYPAGLLFGMIFSNKKYFTRGIVLFLFISISIETLQYVFSLGYAETDDVIHNTSGFIMGYIVSFLSHNFQEKQKNLKTEFCRNEEKIINNFSGGNICCLLFYIFKFSQGS